MLSPADIDKTANRIKDFLVSEITDLAAKLDTAFSNDNKKEGSKILRKLQGRRDSLLIVEGITHNLPDSLEFFYYRPVAAEDSRRITLREEFDTKVRWGFLKAAFKDKATQKNLMEMGLSRGQINLLAQRNRIPQISRGVGYDLTVDHIQEISWGGTNDISNLCIMPSYLNVYKGRFAHIQTRAGLEEILGFRPKNQNGRPTIVPVIPGGFREKTEDDDILRQRMEKLLQKDLHYVHEPS